MLRIISLLFPVSVICQTGNTYCTNTALVPVFKQDFGQSPNSTNTTIAPPNSTNYNFGNVGTDGNYIVTPRVENANKSDWTKGGDHTGNLNGNFFLVNAGGGKNIFLQQTVTGLCPGSNYSFSAWLANVNTPTTKNICGAGIIYPKITFNVKDTFNAIIATYTTDTLPLSQNNGPVNWIKYGFQFSLPAYTGALKIEIIDYWGGGAACGNDVALDDIVFEACVPLITIALTTSSNNVCLGDSAKMLSSLINSPYVSPAYLWQQSLNGGVSWNDIDTAKVGKNQFEIYNAIPANGGIYRVLVGPTINNIKNPTCGAISNGVAFNVNLLPKVNPTTNAPICSGNDLLIKSNASGGAGAYSKYTWSGPATFQLKSADTILSAVQTFRSGMYSVKVIDTNGCKDSSQILVQIDSTPVIKVVAITDTICSNTFALIETKSTLINNQFFWSSSTISGSAISSTNFTNPDLTGKYSSNIINNSSGNAKIKYSIYSKSTSNCISKTIDTTITILPIPSIANAGNDINLCSGTQTALNANTPVIGKGVWKQISGPNKAYFFDSLNAITKIDSLIAGSYLFSWTISNACSSSSDTVLVKYTSKPQPIFTVSDSVACGPVNILFTNNTPNKNQYSYRWDFGNGNTSILADPSGVVFNASFSGLDSVYTIRLTASSNCDTIQYSKSIIIKRKAKTDFTILPKNNCFPITVEFKNQSIGTNPSFKLFFGDGTDTVIYNNSKILYTYQSTVNKNFQPTLIIQNQCGIDSIFGNVIGLANLLNIQHGLLDTTICGSPFVYNVNNATTGANQFTWNWGDGSSNNTATINGTIQHTYQAAGNYNITHTIKHQCGDTIITKKVHIYPSVKALINPLTAEICFSDSIILKSNSDTTLQTFWKINNSAIGTSQLLNYRFASSGNFLVILLVQKINPFKTCIDSVIASINVNPNPTLTFSALTDSICTGNYANINLKSSLSNSRFFWNTPTVSANTIGWQNSSSNDLIGIKKYLIKLNNQSYGKINQSAFAISQKNCKSNVVYADIIVSPLPDIAIAGSNMLICGFPKTSLNANTPVIGKGVWKQISGPNKAFFFDSLNAITKIDSLIAGSYLFSWTISNACSSSSDTVLVKYTSKPQAIFTVSDSVACGPVNILFTNNTPNKNQYSYRWDFGNGNTSILADPSGIVFNASSSGLDTVYTIRLTASSNCDTIQYSKSIIIKRKAFAQFTISPKNICTPLLVEFTNKSGGANTQYQLIFGDGKDTIMQKGSSFTHVYNSATSTIYRPLLIASNSCGSDTASENIQAIASKLIIKNNLIDTAICGFPFVYKINNGTTGSNQFIWNWGDGNYSTTATVGNEQHTYQQAGTYTLTHQIKNICGDTTITKQIRIYPSVKSKIDALPIDQCIGDSITFKTYGDSSSVYQWKINDSIYNNTLQFSKPFYTEGIYKVQLLISKINDGLTCTDSSNQQFKLVATLQGKGNITPVNGNCIPFLVQLINQSKKTVKVIWDMGDGNVVTGDRAQYLYKNPGNFKIRMTATNAGGCKYIDTSSVQIKSAIGNIQFKGGLYCNSNNLVNFNPIVSNTDSIEYNFGDGSIITSSVHSIQHQYLKPGIYFPTFTLINNSGCRIPIPKKDSIIIEKVKAFFKVSTMFNCGITNFIFADSSQCLKGINQYTWKLNNNYIGSNNTTTADFKQTGTNETSLIVSSNYGCIDSIRAAFNVSIYSFPQVSIKSINEACLKNLMELRSEISSIDSIIFRIWNLGNGNKASDSTVRILYFDEGKYTVQLTAATINKCYDSALKQITIHPIPIIKLATSNNLCKGDSLVLKADGATNYVWKDQQENIICNNCLTIKVKPQKTTTYKVIGYNEFGCTEIAGTNVQVIDKQSITVAPESLICEGSSIRIYAIGGTTYQWLPANGLTTYNIAAPIVSPTITTTYKVIGKDAFNCFTDTGYVKVIVGKPTPIKIGKDSSFVAGSSIKLQAFAQTNNIIRWRWSGGANLSCVACPDPVARVVNDETIICTATNNFGCISSDTIRFKTFCPNTEVFIPNAFTPDGDGINDVFYVQSKGIKLVKSMRIYNRWGEVVFEKNNFNPNDINAGWNGRIRGNLANSDVYVYICEVVCEKGAIQLLKGNVAVLK